MSSVAHNANFCLNDTGPIKVQLSLWMKCDLRRGFWTYAMTVLFFVTQSRHEEVRQCSKTNARTCWVFPHNDSALNISIASGNFSSEWKRKSSFTHYITFVQLEPHYSDEVNSRIPHPKADCHRFHWLMQRLMLTISPFHNVEMFVKSEKVHTWLLPNMQLF